MLPGKTYKPEDVLKILRKRVWLVIVPWAIVAAGTAGIARKLPDRYRSQAVIQMVPPRVPESVVRSVNNISMQDRLRATTQSILSRTRLEQLIEEFNLYQEERRKTILQDVVEAMRRDIVVRETQGETFIVSYTGDNPRTVMNVTERLARYFIEASQNEGTFVAENTSAFVESAVETQAQKLRETEAKLAAYKRQYAGELPDQLTANVQAIGRLETQLQTLSQSLNQDAQLRLTLERQIGELEGQGDPASAPPPPPPPTNGEITDVGTGPAAQRAAIARNNLTLLRSQGLSDAHPRVAHWIGLVKQLEAEAEKEALRSPVGAGAGVSAVELARLKRLAQLREDLEMVKKQILAKQGEEKRIRAEIGGFQAKILREPIHSAAMLELTRDYETQKGVYDKLVASREAAQLSVSVERRQIGEQFNLIDRARLPERPDSPNRLVINLLGLAAGLAVGLALVGLLEYRDTTFKTDTELGGVMALPVLAVVPLMRSEQERRADFRRRLFLGLGFGSTVSVCVAVILYSFINLR